ncbi:hypothetical protein N0V93_007111 [Gnomoniopsis smithogilvyi]|uniref:Uncharacterized protein n=1 Tax=Gnomoniopsis smithogilvyi TaxID=1191159 RepID=A0A9W8YQP2_9PEZI|nr:hypothetical protein N0V93_007111 [Gnomoniopsis smithogilvyi]
MASTSTSPAPMRRHRASSSAGIRKHTIPFGLMCRKIRENGSTIGAKKQRIVLPRNGVLKAKHNEQQAQGV